MARTQKNFSVLGDSISTFQGYSPWGAAHYSPDLGAATGVHTVEEFDPDPFLEALDQYGLPRNESYSPVLVD